MPIFVYKAVNVHGETKSGTMRANSLQEARQVLKSKHFRPVAINEQPETLANKEIDFFNKVATPKLVSYLQQFNTLVSAGIPVLEASIMLYTQQEDKVFKKILESVSEEIQGGESLSNAYRKYPNAFPSLLINTVSAAEMSGTLDKSLARMAYYYEKQATAKSSMVTAMIYPVMMIIASLGIGTFLTVSIVPMFVGVFEGFGGDLPGITKFTMGMSNFLRERGLLLAGVIIGVIIGFFIAKRNRNFALAVDIFMLKLPIFGELVQKTNFSIFLSTLSSLLASSVPMITALDMARDVVSNAFIKNMITLCQAEIEQGGQLSNVFADSWVVPAMATQMVKIGENTGQLEDMLRKLSTVFEAEVDEASKRLKTIMEPIIMLVICGIVGFIVAAIMIPMFAMFESIQG